MSEQSTTHDEDGKAVSYDFMRIGMDKLLTLRGELDELNDALMDVEALCDTEGAKQVARLIRELEQFEPSITMVGQIKSGKTSLVNAMVGRPGLLPADVNPWTSVVTSLHLNVPQEENAPVASFQFFDADEWDHLVSSGGRIGELSMRAGADEELQKVHEQIAEMREKTMTRLGRRFELLLGQRHDYREFDDDLMQRYVCLGDDFDDVSPDEQQGRFADITKSADLYLDAPALPVPLCIRDTPGVNDTFMMREQITIKSLRDSRLCVVVLSASQALSSVDMGLIRMISNVKSEGIVIFVNRIDELSDPVNQLPDIRDSILSTLSKLNGPQDPVIVFGSAYWANMAISESMDDFVEDSADALRRCAQAVFGSEDIDFTQRDLIWQLSGVPHLFDTLSDRIAAGPGARLLAHLRKRACNFIAGLRAASSVASIRIDGGEIEMMQPQALSALLDQVEANAKQRLDAALNEVFGAFAGRVDQSHARFLDRALESLLQHLEQNGENEVWQYSPDGLRMLLRTSYQVLRKNLIAACSATYGDAANDISEAYHKAVAAGVDGFAVTPPSPPEVPAPVSLGATIALDLQTSWWNGWWKRRRGYRAYASGFQSLIEAETTPLISELKDRQAAEIRQAATDRLTTFLAEQRSILMGIAEKAHINMGDLQDLFGIKTQTERAELLEMIYDELSGAEEPAEDAGEATARKGAAA
ncbi:dynamin family protein [Defluviimonas aestuarii]|uniref:dynamin family protein n=1 Tax=Albidovulum aestuarii TaxID=1130726 RepID=UPI00249ACFC2|nr:dynamin family protein [Defluviimonas aestuarii]MDI3336713.1 dynamin family protein [Defluviimonas aestuarii]